MAFVSTITGHDVWGNKSITHGTWTTDTTGGDIDTGLTLCEGMTLQHTGSSAIADEPAVNEVFPIRATEPSGTVEVTIVCTSGKGGNWRAWGV